MFTRPLLACTVLLALLVCIGCGHKTMPPPVIQVTCPPCKCQCGCECKGACQCPCPAPVDPMQSRRIDALVEITGACSDVSEVFFSYAGKELSEESAKKVSCRYRLAINAARKAVNRNLIVLGTSIDKPYDLYLNMHRAFLKVELETVSDEYRVLMARIENYMDDVARAALEQKPMPDWPAADIRFAERIKLSPTEYLQRHLKAFDPKKVSH